MNNDNFLYLVTRKLTNEITAEEADELKQILAISAVYRQQCFYLESFWQEKKSLPVDIKNEFNKLVLKIEAIEKSKLDISTPTEKKAPVFKLKYPFKKIASAAAVLLLLVASVYFLYQFKGGKKNNLVAVNGSDASPVNWVEKKNGKEKKLFVTLPDNTKVWLNSESKIRYNKDFGVNTREVYLDGEAFFDVTHNEKVPMTVHAQNIEIHVKGTAFNVKAYDNNRKVETSLIRGLVEIVNDIEPDRKIMLKPNEKIIVMNSGEINLTRNEDTANKIRVQQDNTTSPYIIQKLQPETSSKIIPEIAWLQDKLVFNHESFEDLAVQMERRYGVVIRFENDKVKSYQYTGAFDKENIKQALTALQLSYHFEYSIHNNEIMIAK